MVSIIVAVARNNAIGFENKLLYWLPNDLKRFRTLTTGHTIVMGRRTFESLPKGALPNRRNMVLSRTCASFEGAECFHSLQEALSACESTDEVFVIGGASLYAEAMSVADRLYLTLVDDTPSQADAFFPTIDATWKETWREQHSTDEKHAHAYTFLIYQRYNH
ncbi:MAG: dihydrofolate reductase [Bacteroidales bacterium]|nr:dihydrofolate reductase [Bacteroidales bacterium]